MPGLSAIACSSRRLPMKHQGQTTSETTSIVSGSALSAGMGFSFFYAEKIGCGLLGGNRCHHGIGDALEEGFRGIAELQEGERHHRVDAALAAVGVLPIQHGLAHRT